MKERRVFVQIKGDKPCQGGVAGYVNAELGKKNRSAGFTLIELAMVILLLGLFAGLSMPLLLNFGQDDLDASARRLSGTVKYLYNEAALTGLEHRLVFNLADGSYEGLVLERDGELTLMTGPGRGGHLSGDVRFRDIYQPGTGTSSQGEVTMALLPGGWLEETVLHLVDGNGENRSLRLVPLTGMTEAYDGYWISQGARADQRSGLTIGITIR